MPLQSSRKGTDHRVYVRKQIATRWRLEAKASTRLLVFSPYVTSPCAKQILMSAFGDCELHTVFEAKAFATRASSLDTLEYLLENGVAVYHIPDLHAKVLLAPGQAVVIGSQNLTKKGKTNLEANVLLRDRASVEQVAREVGPWLDRRVPITKEMIAHMRRAVRTLKRAFAAAEAQAADLDRAVWEGQKSRDEEHERQRREAERLRAVAERQREIERERERLREQLRERIRAAVARARVARETVYGEVQVYDRISKMSLIANGNSTYTEWRVDSGEYRLVRTNRYLCLHEESCKLGWSRVGRTRITLVGKAISNVGHVQFGGLHYKVSLAAEWNESLLGDHNLTVTLVGVDSRTAVLECLFAVDTLEVARGRWTGPAPSDAEDLTQSINDNRDGIRDRLIRLVVTPFKYERNLNGVKADRFFGPKGSRFRTKLAFVQDQPVLTTAKSWW